MSVVTRACSIFSISTSSCVSRHNSVHFCNMSTSKNAPEPWCLAHFDLEMCFAPQRRTLFQRLNVVQTVLQRRALFDTETSKHFPNLSPQCGAICPDGFSTRRNHKTLEKNTVFRDFPTFSCICIFFLLTLSLLSSSLFCFSICPYCRKFDF